MAEQFVDEMNEFFIEDRFKRLEKSLKEKGYTIPILTRARSISHIVPSISLSMTTAPTYSDEYDPYSLSGILSRIAGEGAETKRTNLRIQFNDIWRWMAEGNE